MQQRTIYKGRIAWQQEQPAVARGGKSGAYPCERARKSVFVIADQAVGIAGVTRVVPIARQQELIGQWAGNVMQPGDQWATSPLQQPLILTAHTLPAASGQKQNGAGLES